MSPGSSVGLLPWALQSQSQSSNRKSPPLPKADPHFDYAGLCEEVLAQDLGLFITTNNPGGFRRVLYTHMRKKPEHKLVILQDPSSPNRLVLLKQGLDGASIT